MRVLFLSWLRCERRAAPTASGRIRVREGEARSHHVGDIINLDAIQILRAEHVDEQPDAFFVEHKIALA